MATWRRKALAGALLAGTLAVSGVAAGALVVGKPGPDVLRGTDAADVLKGRAGDDLLLGGAGDDVLLGEQGDDVIVGGPGSDILRGGLGSDVLRAKDGDVDVLSCGPGRDSFTADAADVVGPDCEGAPKSSSQPPSSRGAHELRVEKVLGGIVTSSPAGINCGQTAFEDQTDCRESFPAGTRVSLTAKRSLPLAFWYWIVSCSGKLNPCTLVMDGDKTVSLRYKLG